MVRAPQFTVGLLAAFAPSALASCAYGTHLHKRTGEVATPNFSYWGATGPAAWHVINEDYYACANGTNQSPISVAANNTDLVPASTLKFDLGSWPAGATFEHLGTTIEVVALGGNLTIGSVDYSLAQFHFHLPSEHLDDGNSYAMEMHLVWQSADSQIAVTGMFVDVDYLATVHPLKVLKGKKAQAAYEKGYTVEANDVIENSSDLVESVLNLADKIPTLGMNTTIHALNMSLIADQFNNGSFHHYHGSLTTPPCTENVEWYLSDQLVHITSSSFIKARKALGYNARFPQGNPGETNVLAL